MDQIFVTLKCWLVGAVPVLLPAHGHAACVATLLARLDGLILTGSRSLPFSDSTR